MRVTISQACDFYIDYYRPRLFTSFERHFAARINSTSKFVMCVPWPRLVRLLSSCRAARTERLVGIYRKNGNETNFSPFISRKAIHQPSSRCVLVASTAPSPLPNPDSALFVPFLLLFF